jgi:hypothetical protein
LGWVIKACGTPTTGNEGATGRYERQRRESKSGKIERDSIKDKEYDLKLKELKSALPFAGLGRS